MISVIVTVYNKENYLQRCLDSILAQTYTDFELIIVNDGSTDQSQAIIERYQDTHDGIRVFTNKNAGVSFTRNFGISKAKGQYFLFVDADDYIEPDLLQTLSRAIISNPHVDVISFNITKINDGCYVTIKVKKPDFGNISGEHAIREFILGATPYGTPVAYLYRKEYWDASGFKYAQNRYHEDFGLTPLVIMKANQVISLDYFGYYNVLSENSIMRTSDKDKTLQKAYDFLYHFDVLVKESEQVDMKKDTLDLFHSHIVHALIKKAMTLPKNARKKYAQEIRKRNIYLLLPTNNIKRIIKYLAVRINIRCYWYLYLCTRKP